MPETDDGDVRRQAFQVTYDGPHDTHAMDVQDLAPALVAFGRLIREANAQLNGDKATVKVLVTSDFEHRCFNISFELVQSILRQIASFLQSEEVKTARQILIDLGIIAGGPGLGLLGYLRWKKDRKVTQVRDSDTTGVVVVQIGDGNTAQVRRDAITLAENPKIRTAVEGTFAPLGSGEISKIKFKDESDPGPGSTYDETDAKEIVAAFDPLQLSAEPVTEDQPDTISAWLRVYSPVYDEKAEKWRFYYGDHSIYADISQTSIAKDAIKRGGAFINDLYKVKMEVRQHLTDGGSLRPEYKIIEVIDFRPALQQQALPLHQQSADGE